VEPYITIPELAKKGTIPLGETKLYELANRGRIPSYRVGKKILVLESEVYEAIKAFSIRMIHGRALVR
jgi:excisionase family DNA binding protein